MNVAAGRAGKAAAGRRPPMTNEYTNEALYAGLADGTLPEEALVTLRDRLYPIILNEAKPYFQKLGWTSDDALQEALILIWQTVTRKTFDPSVARGQYHHFFSAAWKNHMISLYRKAIRQPVVLGQAQLGYSSTGEPVYVEAYGFDPKYEEYLRRHREECKRSEAKKREAEGRPAPQPVKRLADLTAEELEARRLARNAKALANYHARREEKLAAQKAYRDAHREELNRKQRERDAAKRAAKLAAKAQPAT